MPVTEILTLLSAVTAAAVAIINALNAKGRDHKLALNTELTAQTQQTAAKIQTLVNGQSEALKSALVAAQARNRVLEAALARRQDDARSQP